MYRNDPRRVSSPIKPSFSCPLLLRRQSRSATKSRFRFQSLMRSGRKYSSPRNSWPAGCATYTKHPSDTSVNLSRTNAISTSFLPKFSREALASARSSCLAKSCREYFYRLPPAAGRRRASHALRSACIFRPCASPSELRVAFKLRDLELKSMGVPHAERVALERAFNIVGQPELRACYDSLLADAEAPAIFPYGGFGSLLVGGEPSRDGKTFFARRILAFSPDLQRRRFHVPLRKCDFYDDRALCRDARRKLEFWLDPVALQTHWDRTWNQWKHLLGTKIEVEGTFVQSGKYRKRERRVGTRDLGNRVAEPVECKSAIRFPAAIGVGESDSSSLWPVLAGTGSDSAASGASGGRAHGARTNLLTSCDFRVTSMSHKSAGVRITIPSSIANSRGRARRIYLFRQEYIFDVEKAVVVETPQLGHATYIFAKPRSMDTFSRPVYIDHERRHPPEPRQCSREARIPGPRDSRHESASLAQGNPAAHWGRELM